MWDRVKVQAQKGMKGKEARRKEVEQDISEIAAFVAV